MDEPITEEEIIRVVQSMQNGKCPGIDGYTVEFYKKFINKLAPLLLDMFQDSFDNASLPQTLTQASIFLILKKGKDALQCGSYRPISLLNVDYKMLAKLLATRMESWLPSIISPDQTGFIKDRHAFSNIRRALNVIYSPPTQDGPEVILSMDAEKAFDRVEWGYLFYTLEKFYFPQNFISWIRLLYSAPKASVRTNNLNSVYFPLQRSTRQGCPLSPLLFAVAIEPLAEALRSNNHITGIFRHNREQKLSLYADDLLIYVSNLPTSIPTILSILDSFSSISGYKLNLSKSELFPLNSAAAKYSLHTLPFKVVHDKFKYLGVSITDKFENLFKCNFCPLITSIKKDLARWSLLPLSLAARINTIKMNTLPKLSYLFQTLPIFIPKLFFRKLDTLILEFIWNKRPPRLRKSLLQQTKSLGGMALPHMQFYYWAANLRALQFWISYNSFHSPPEWLHLEAASCYPFSLYANLYTPLDHKAPTTIKNTVVKSSVKIWKQFRRHFNFQNLSLSCPLISNHLFFPSTLDKGFNIWDRAGIKTLHDLYVEGTFVSFQYLVEKFSIHKNNFFRYLQVRSFASSVNPQFPSAPEPTALDTFLKPLPIFKKMISQLYNLISSVQVTCLSNLKVQWEKDLGVLLTEDEWQQILYRIHSSSFCAKHGMIQCKLFHRVYWTKARLNKIYPDTDPLCDRCHRDTASLIHMFWLCPSLFKFWTEIFSTLSEVFGMQLDPNPVTAIFGVLPSALLMSKHHSDFVAFVTLLARRLILLKWKLSAPPMYSEWIRDVLRYSTLERIRCTLNDSLSKFKKSWQPFFTFMDNLSLVAIPE
uniref:Reverse transcriptase domain-containing protein n=1 Tax=Astyanax mexicanus TaxID=7994 RepID=A0A3B1IPQ1_ASTMX